MSNRTVSVWTLVSLIIGSTIGSGIFALPQNIGSVAGPGSMGCGAGWRRCAARMVGLEDDSLPEERLFTTSAPCL